MTAFAPHRKRRKLKSEINVVPYIDVMLVLLIIFMVTAPLLTLSIDVDLPVANAKALESKQDPIIVTAYADGRLAMQLPKGELQSMSADEMRQRLAAIVSQDRNVRVVLAAEAQAPYQRVIDATSVLKAARVEKVALLTDSGGNAR